MKSLRSPHWDIDNPAKSWQAKASDYSDDFTIGGQVGQSNTKGRRVLCGMVQIKQAKGFLSTSLRFGSQRVYILKEIVKIVLKTSF